MFRISNMNFLYPGKLFRILALSSISMISIPLLHAEKHNIAFLNKQMNMFKEQFHLYKRCLKYDCTEQERETIKRQLITAMKVVLISLGAVGVGVWGVQKLWQQYNGYLLMKWIQKTQQELSKADFKNRPIGWKSDEYVLTDDIKASFKKESDNKVAWIISIPRQFENIPAEKHWLMTEDFLKLYPLIKPPHADPNLAIVLQVKLPMGNTYEYYVPNNKNKRGGEWALLLELK